MLQNDQSVQPDHHIVHSTFPAECFENSRELRRGAAWDSGRESSVTANVFIRVQLQSMPTAMFSRNQRVKNSEKADLWNRMN
jgi:hypothetical protein